MSNGACKGLNLQEALFTILSLLAIYQNCMHEQVGRQHIEEPNIPPGVSRLAKVLDILHNATLGTTHSHSKELASLSTHLYRGFPTEDHQNQDPFQWELVCHLSKVAHWQQGTAQERKVQASCKDGHGLEYLQLSCGSLLVHKYTQYINWKLTTATR